MIELIDEVSESLGRIQTFDVSSLPRNDDLGRELNFEAAVEPAMRVIDLFNLIPISSLHEFPDQEKQVIRVQADTTFNKLEECLNFSITGQQEGNLQTRRDSLIDGIDKSYQQVFSQLHSLISYASSRAVDFGRLEEQGRAAVQSVRDRADKLTTSLQKHEEQAKSIIQDVQKAAAEQGVSQQALYFKTEADNHETAAKNWKTATIIAAILLGSVAIASLFLHKWTYLAPTSPFESIQLVVSKVLLFGVVAYLVGLSARNFLSHRHNAVVNRHRQNALMTFTALTEASSTGEAQDIVLSHAAGCIFAPQPTGYTKLGSVSASSSPISVANALPRVLSSRAVSGADSQ